MNFYEFRESYSNLTESATVGNDYVTSYGNNDHWILVPDNFCFTSLSWWM